MPENDPNNIEPPQDGRPDPAHPAHPEFVHALLHFPPHLIITSLLLATNIFIYVWQGTHGTSWTSPGPDDLIAWGANYGPLTVLGEWWRLPVSMFLHAGALHLAVNMYALWQLGRLMERVLGQTGFFMLYMISGLAAGLCSLRFHFDVPCVGASGALFGVFGGYAAFLVRMRRTIPKAARRQYFRGLFFLLGLNLLLGWSIPEIDLSAHVGGFIVGFVLGLLLVQRLTPEGIKGRWFRNTWVAAVALPLLAWGAFAAAQGKQESATLGFLLGPSEQKAALELIARDLARHPNNARSLFWQAQVYAGQKQWAHVLQSANQAVLAGETGSMVHLLRGQALGATGDRAGAMAAYGKAIAIEPQDPTAYNARGFEQWKAGNAAQAEADWKQAGILAGSKAEAAEYLENIGILYAARGDWRGLLRQTEQVMDMNDQSPWNILLRLIAADKTNDRPLAQTMEAQLQDFTQGGVSGTELDWDDLREALPEDLRHYVDEQQKMLQ